VVGFFCFLLWVELEVVMEMAEVVTVVVIVVVVMTETRQVLEYFTFWRGVGLGLI